MVSIDTGALMVEIEPPAADTQNVEYGTLTATGNVPNSTGAFEVNVTNVSGTEESTDFDAVITVNGEPLPAGATLPFRAVLDPVLNKFYYCPLVAVTITGNGAVRYNVLYP